MQAGTISPLSTTSISLCEALPGEPLKTEKTMYFGVLRNSLSVLGFCYAMAVKYEVRNTAPYLREEMPSDLQCLKEPPSAGHDCGGFWQVWRKSPRIWKQARNTA